MGLFEQLPYTNFSNINLTEIIRAIKQLEKEMHDFTIVNKIEYMGAWNITTQYPSWSVVVVGGTTGYISIQPVPVGINYTNTDYWRLIADFSIELANLGNRVATLENEMDTAQGDITTLTNVTNWLHGLLTNSTRKVVCISDSYGLTPSTDTSWIVWVKNLLNISNDNFYRSQANGAGFIGLYPSYTFKAQLTTLASGMTADERNAINDILIVGGYNDADRLMNGDYTVTQLRDAITSCMTYARTTFPNAKIYVSCVAWRIDNFVVHKYIRIIENLYQQTCMNTNRVSYIEGVYWLHRQALVDATGFHPTAIGAECIGKSIASVLNGGTNFCDLAVSSNNGSIAVTGSWTSNINALTFTDVKQIYNNGSVYTSWQQIAFTPTVNISGNGEIALLNLTDGCVQGGEDFHNAAVIPCIAQVSGTNRKGNLLIHNNQLYFGNGENSQINSGASVNIIYGGGVTSVML